MSGATGFGSFEGQPVQVAVAAGNPEAQKYGRMWELPEYRAVSPGEGLAQFFLSQAKPKAGAEVIDFGCGTGRGALMLALLGGMRVTMVDFVRNCLDPEIREALTTQAHALRFVKADLEKPIPLTAEYGYCCDVMEHIPEDKVHLVLSNILKSAQHVFFNISTVDDSCGKMIGETLHLTVKPYSWWLATLTGLGCAVHFAKETPGGALFYVSAWRSGEELVNAGVVNTADEKVKENVAANIAGDWQQVTPHLSNDIEVMVVGGGPSAAAYLDRIKSMRERGVKLITLNGAYNWALENGLTPSAQVMVDAREFNARFTKPVVDGCKYLIASQCHPSVFEGLPKDRTYIWHTSAEFIFPLLQKRYEHSFPIPGGSTVLLRAIPLLRMLGFRKFHLFGCDSCIEGSQHHAYAQPENDADRVIPVIVAGRTFYCHAWMISQAQELQDLIRVFGEQIDLEIYGDGLLAFILKTAADMQDAEELAVREAGDSAV